MEASVSSPSSSSETLRVAAIDPAVSRHRRTLSVSDDDDDGDAVLLGRPLAFASFPLNGHGAMRVWRRLRHRTSFSLETDGVGGGGSQT